MPNPTVALPDRLAKLPELQLDSGGHSNFEDGFCATELISWLADEPFSDHPKCLSPVLGAFLRRWNDGTDEEGRQKLKPYLPRGRIYEDVKAEALKKLGPKAEELNATGFELLERLIDPVGDGEEAKAA